MSHKTIIIVSIGFLILLFSFLNINRFFFIQDWTFKPFPAAEFELDDLSGNKFKFKKNRPTLIIFWATWCPTCKDDLTYFSKLSLNNSLPNMDFIAIALDENVAHVRQIISELQLHENLILLTDNKGIVAPLYDVYSVPETFLIDKNGIAKKRYLGPVSPIESDFIYNLKNLLE